MKPITNGFCALAAPVSPNAPPPPRRQQRAPAD
jgi:hypothetical protein